MISSVLLFPNASRDTDLTVTRRAAALLRACGAEPLLPSQTEGAEALSDAARIVPLGQALEQAQLIVTLGGDGTILRIARQAAERELPILGIQMGRLGFLAELDVSRLTQLQDVIAGRGIPDERMMLTLQVFRDGAEVYEDLALNEVLLIGGGTGRFISLSVMAEQREIMTFSGDGVLVATPTGSTAYSLSAGGPILEPTAESIVITPICAHALYAKSVVLSPTRAVTVRSRHTRPIYLNVDGKGEFPFWPEDRLIVRRAAQKTRLLHLRAHDFFGLLGQKFRYPVD